MYILILRYVLFEYMHNAFPLNMDEFYFFDNLTTSTNTINVCVLSCVDGSISFKKCFNTIFPAVFHLNNKYIHRNHVLFKHLSN